MKYLIILLVSGCSCAQPLQQTRAITTSTLEIRLKMLEDKVEALRPVIVKDVNE